jgi:hypothetical protein
MEHSASVNNNDSCLACKDCLKTHGDHFDSSEFCVRKHRLVHTTGSSPTGAANCKNLKGTASQCMRGKSNNCTFQNIRRHCPCDWDALQLSTQDNQGIDRNTDGKSFFARNNNQVQSSKSENHG